MVNKNEYNKIVVFSWDIWTPSNAWFRRSTHWPTSPTQTTSRSVQPYSV